jgi:preprotein translocase subunit SecA
MVADKVSKALSKVFGSRNDRLIKQYRRRVEQINELEPEVRQLTDAQLKDRTAEFQKRITEDGEKVRDLLPEIMATAREVMDRSVGIRNILNPEHGFDPGRLTGEARAAYDRAMAQVAELEPDEVVGGEPAPPWMRVELPNLLYDAVRELYPESRPPFRARPFDVQLIGGMVLGEGKIAEMKTGEGKTIVAPLACYVAICEGLKCHVVTVNDYLVQRDRDWVFPFYYATGLTVGAIHPFHQQPPQLKAKAYTCDTVYGTNSEFGFDYLRDNMKMSTAEQVQKQRDFCIIDEVDSILIDEARTPLIISGPAHDEPPDYNKADQIARHLIQMQRQWDAIDTQVQQTQVQISGLEGDIRNTRDKKAVPQMKQRLKDLQAKLVELEDQRDQHTQYYEVEPEKKAAHLTHDGVAEAQKKANIGSFYVGNNMDFPHLLVNSLRAHTVYKKDQHYVVQNGEVVIVDENTGRLMVGRQWSDGLHQAVETKENVKVKQETQTLATVTIQNFFKLYQRLAGMTGTAITEATEFGEIYKLDVVSIPTNKPVIRNDRNDLIFLSEKDKWNAIVDEIKRVHDLGRPVLVGTTSVEKSEMLSRMLTQRHGIKHAVLNAKAEHAEREGNIVEDAGVLGAVMIATNMAGRGTDIKLRPIDRAALVEHWQRRNTLPREATPEMSDDELIALSYRHQAIQQFKVPKAEAKDASDEDLKLRLLRHWVAQDAFVEEDKAQKMDLDQCMAALDDVPDYQRHRLEVYGHIEQMGGLHILGTERHESRRIDNQLRGRSGRQGDRGASRFFLSLEDDLMKMFAGDKTLAILSKLGMKEGDAIEHGMVSRSVQRAQRKVEQRNYEIRKNLLEYDEVMEYQRNTFYGTRQEVLEGSGIAKLIFDYIGEAVDEAADIYLAPDYVQSQIAQWARQTLDVSVDPSRLHPDDPAGLEEAIRDAARSDTMQTIELTLGEYMSNDIPPEEWDLRGLSQWAMSRFGVDLKQNKARQMSVDEVRDTLTDAAIEQIDKKDLSGVGKYLGEDLAAKDFAEWCGTKFGIRIEPAELSDRPADEATRYVLDQARSAYRRREVRYPVEFIMDVLVQGLQQDPNWAVAQLQEWTDRRYQQTWGPEQLDGKQPAQIAEELEKLQRQWIEDGELDRWARSAVQEHGRSPEKLAEAVKDRWGREPDADAWSAAQEGRLELPGVTLAAIEADDDEADADERRPQRGETDDAMAPERALQKVAAATGLAVLRDELTQLERYVLLRILDQTWKDHLYGMDQLKDSIGLRGYAERDPKIEYKREGAEAFRQMQAGVREKVTELIFRAKLTPNVQVRSAYSQQQVAQHAAASGGASGGASGAAGGTQPRQAGAGAGAAASAATGAAAGGGVPAGAGRPAGSSGGTGDGPARGMTRRQRRAAAARKGGGTPGGRGRKRR